MTTEMPMSLVSRLSKIVCLKAGRSKTCNCSGCEEVAYVSLYTKRTPHGALARVCKKHFKELKGGDTLTFRAFQAKASEDLLCEFEGRKPRSRTVRPPQVGDTIISMYRFLSLLKMGVSCCVKDCQAGHAVRVRTPAGHDFDICGEHFKDLCAGSSICTEETGGRKWITFSADLAAQFRELKETLRPDQEESHQMPAGYESPSKRAADNIKAAAREVWEAALMEKVLYQFGDEGWISGRPVNDGACVSVERTIYNRNVRIIVWQFRRSADRKRYEIRLDLMEPPSMTTQRHTIAHGEGESLGEAYAKMKASLREAGLAAWYAIGRRSVKPNELDKLKFEQDTPTLPPPVGDCGIK